MSGFMGWLLRLAMGRVPWEPVNPVDTIPKYKLPEVWPSNFGGERPDTWVVHRLLENIEGLPVGHLYYRSPLNGKIALGVVTDEQVHRAKDVMFWLNGGTIDPEQKFRHVSGTCGKPHCIAPEHLSASYVDPPVRAVEKPVVPPPEAGPPVYRAKRNKRKYNPKTDPDRDESTRSLCVSAKYTYNEETAKRIERQQHNRVENTGAKKLYAYQCEWCNKWHHSSHDPKKWKKHHVKNSSY